MKIVVLNRNNLTADYLDWSRLDELGEVTIYETTKPDQVIDRIGDAEAVFANGTRMNEDVFKSCPNLKYIGVFSTGYNNIDTDAAKRYGITVTNVPAYGTKIVSQNAVALLLEVTNRIASFDKDVKQGKWDESNTACASGDPIIELDGKTAGIIGFGRIGRQSGRVLSALGMDIIYHDLYEADADYPAEKAELDELLRRSDVILLHCLLNDSNRGLISKDTIAKMKDGVIIVNNARGPLIVEADLYEALKSGKVRAAALDVACHEPIEDDNPLLKCDNCIITPHISWSSDEARVRMFETGLNNLRSYIGGKPVNVVNE